MTTTPAREAIAMLINLAERGEIDPWDVPVIQTIDRFLSELGLMGQTDKIRQEADLPRSGQAFLWASMLVLLKANTLQTLPEEIEDIEEIENIEEPIEVNGRILPLHLENQLRRRTSVPFARKRRVTLQELIAEIENIAAELEEQTSSGKNRQRGYSRKEAVRAIAQLAHNENLTEMAIELEHLLYKYLPQMTSEQNGIDWEQLLNWWQQQNFAKGDSNSSPILPTAADRHSSSDRAGVFWGLLLLSAQSKVELVQKEFYQDLQIIPLGKK